MNSCSQETGDLYVTRLHAVWCQLGHGATYTMANSLSPLHAGRLHCRVRPPCRLRFASLKRPLHRHVMQLLGLNFPPNPLETGARIS